MLQSSAAPLPSMGILQLKEAGKAFALERFPPSAELAPFVRHYWSVIWDLRGREPYRQDVIPNPCVNLVAESGRIGLYGAASRKYTKRLEGQGRVFGVKFKPGGFYPYFKRPLTEITDGEADFASVMGVGGSALTEAVASAVPVADLIELTEKLLLSRLPEPDDTVAFVNDIVECAKARMDMTKVEQLCEAFGIHIRKLQRLFGQYVGVSPKWVIRLYRLQNAAEAIDRGIAPDWSRMSQELGYFDQAHFIKDFKTIIGVTPDEYGRKG
jgi:AraC-type DNA-binding domain-containing proteins